MNLSDTSITRLFAEIEQPLDSSTISTGLLWYYFTRYRLQPIPQYRAEVMKQWESLIGRATDNRYIVPSLLITPQLQTEGWISDEQKRVIQACEAQLLSGTSDWLAEPVWENLYRVAEVGYYFAHHNTQNQLTTWIDTFTAGIITKQPFERYVRAERGFLLGVEGLAGILLMLVSVARISQNHSLREILRAGVYYLLTFRQEVDFSAQRYAVFPRLAHLPQQSSPWSNCLGWSGSDLMQSLVLYRAANLLHDPSLRKVADLVGLNTLLRKEEKDAAVDSINFYQGTAGIAQCYWSLYQASGQKAYRQGYKYWMERTLQQLATEAELLYEDYDLLHGKVGIALTLLTCQHAAELGWEKVVLLN